jgi:hypothetical protein
MTEPRSQVERHSLRVLIYVVPDLTLCCVTIIRKVDR